MSEQFTTTAELIAKHELRDRIAAVLEDAAEIRCIHKLTDADIRYMADNVIEALGLVGCLIPPDNGLPPEVQIPPRAVGHWMTTGRPTDE